MAKSPDIEKLVERAYKDIEPPAYVAEELAESLPATRVRPRRAWVAMLAWPAAAAAIVGGVIWLQQRPKDEPSSAGMVGPGEPAERPDSRRLDVAEIWVRGDGRVMVPVEGPVAGRPGAWKWLSLDALGEHLVARGQAYDAQMRKEKRSGYDTLPDGVTASRVQVRIKADADAPWRYVQWIMTVCAQKRFPKLVFVKDNDIVDVPLPTDLGLLRGFRQRIKIRVDVRLRTPDPFGGPSRSKSVYSFNQKTTTEISDVANLPDKRVQEPSLDPEPVRVAGQPVEEPAENRVPKETVTSAVLPPSGPHESRQVQFIVGTTRVIWTLDPDFDLGPSRTAEQGETS